jgi:beta-N-acetylhexosaminidase
MRRRFAATLIAAPIVVPLVAPPGPANASVPSDLAHRALPAAMAARVYDSMTPRERVGQLFMVGVPTTGPTALQVSRLQALDVGNVVLNGNSHQRLATVAAITSSLSHDLTVRTAAPYISTDQEGGEVQRLTGAGFSLMPTALAQGQLAKSELRADATRWGGELARAGVNLNFAPVADTVPAKSAVDNQPIGRYQREYGHTPTRVARHVVAVVEGERQGGVAVTAKHFPGLGRATGNTDIARHVTDPTTRHDPYLQPFQAAVTAAVPFVMVSMATYPNIDAHRAACFSRIVMRRMLRHDLGFRGVIISDSFHARAVAHVPAARQALRFFTAGGTMLLDTKTAPIHAMEHAVLQRASASKAFAAVLKRAELKVLTAKATANLLRPAA